MKKILLFITVLLTGTMLTACSSEQEKKKTKKLENTTESTIKKEEVTKTESPKPSTTEERKLYEGVYELPISGTTGYSSISMELKDKVSIDAQTIEVLAPGTAYTILKEENEWLNVKIGEKSGWVQAQYSLVNLPDIIPSIIYKNTNVDASVFRSSGQEIPEITGKHLYNSQSFNQRLGKYEYIIPVLYPMAKKLMATQKLALSEGNTLIIYEGFRPLSVQLKIVDQLKKLAQQNVQVMQGITQSPWSIDWFISTKISNHQVGYAVDISLGKITREENKLVGDYMIRDVLDYQEYKMQTSIHELSVQSAIYLVPVTANSISAWRDAPESPKVNEYTKLLQRYSTTSGLTPLASEWWHFNDLTALSLLGGKLGTGDFTLTVVASELP